MKFFFKIPEGENFCDISQNLVLKTKAWRAFFLGICWVVDEIKIKRTFRC